MIFSVVVVDNRMGISRKGVTPWQSPAQDRWFKGITEKGAVVMDTRKYEGELFSRDTRKVTPLFSDTLSFVTCADRYYDAPGASIVPNWAYLRDYINRYTPTQRLYVVGGAQVFRESIKDVAGIFMTHVEGDYGCDEFYPFSVPELRTHGFYEASSVSMNGGKFSMPFPKTYASTRTDPQRTHRLFYRDSIKDQLKASSMGTHIQGM